MEEFEQGPTVDARVIKLAQKQFGTIEEAREALHKVVEEIPAGRLRDVRGIQVFLMK